MAGNNASRRGSQVSVAHLPQRKIWQRYAFPLNPVKLSALRTRISRCLWIWTLFLQTASAALWVPDSVLLCALLLTPPNEWWLYLAIAVPIRLIPTPHPTIPLWFVFATSANDLLKRRLQRTSYAVCQMVQATRPLCLSLEPLSV